MEIFGVVAGTVGVACAFNNCVTCFEYIQFGRNFGEDFAKSQLQLDIARNRLVRWGQAVDINNNPIFAKDSTDGMAAPAGDILDAILHYFKRAHDKSKRYEAKLKPDSRAEGLEVLRPEDMSPPEGRVHLKLKERARKWQQGNTFINKTVWALKDKKELEGVVSNIKDFIEDLEDLCSEVVDSRRDDLIRVEIEEIESAGHEPGLRALQDAAVDTDDLLSQAAAQKVKEISGRNTVGDITAGEDSSGHVGNFWTEEALRSPTAIIDRTENSVGTATLTGRAHVQIGQIYGGKRDI